MPICWSSPNHIDPSSTFTAFPVSVVVGAGRFAHTSRLRGDRALHALLWGQREKIHLPRADSGFCDDKLLSFLEPRLLPYIVMAKLTSCVKRAAPSVEQGTILDDTRRASFG
jgi:hypothetical protein